MIRRLLGSLVFLSCLTALGCGGDGSTPDASADGAVDAPTDGNVDAAPPPAPEVDTTLGRVRGKAGDGYLEFLGIPYAEPPVGDLRFAPPVAHAAWSDTLDATEKGPACIQRALGLSVGEEDCLYVNVDTPALAPASAPVMVWIHGGAFIFGEGVQTDNGTRGDMLAAQSGVVVVSMNYRLGAFGWLAHSGLGAEDGGRSGNQGLLDQLLALRWVHDNIAAFGGDPDNVTLFGESAGGLSVCLHLVSSESAGLFSRAIVESGLCDSALPSQGDAEAVGAALATDLGCDTAADPIACMRSKTSSELLDASSPAGPGLDLDQRFWPNIDGRYVEGDFRSRVEAGALADLPLIFGWNADEGTLFVALGEQDAGPTTEMGYHDGVARLATTYAIPASEIEARYPLGDYPDPGAALAAAMGDASLACPSRRAAELAAAHASVYVYHFEYPGAGFQIPLSRDMGAFHSAEIQYVFGHPSAIGQRRFRGDDLALNERMRDYWTSFAADGDPNVPGTPTWPAWDATSDQHMILDADSRAGSGASADACTFWNR